MLKADAGVVAESGLAHSGILGRVRYVPAFDGLRTLCITLVIIFHAVPRGPYRINRIAGRGWCGVDVFFVLSGFLITWIVTAELDETSTVKLARFYGRRALRLQPAYFSGLFGYLVLLFFLDRARFPLLLNAIPFLLTYSLNLALALGVIGYPPYGPAWSLCIEEQFYLCWPWALRCFGSRRSLRIVLVIIVAILVYRFVVYWWLNWGHFVEPSAYSMDRIYYGTDTRIDTILVGCATALALREPALQTLFQGLREWSWFSCTASVAGLLAFGWATGGSFKGGWRAVTLGFTLMSITSAGVILAIFLQPHSLLARVLSLSPIVFVGKLSYGMYLFHGPVVGALVRGLHWQARAISVKQELIGFLVTLIGSIVLAYAHYHVIEKRFLALRYRLDARRPHCQMRQLSA